MATNFKNIISSARNEKERKGIEQMIYMLLVIRQMKNIRYSHDKNS